MAGLLLNGNLGAQASASTGAGPATISDAAYGVDSGLGTGDGGPKTAGFGTVTTGLIGTAVLLFLWYSLPR